MDFYGADRVMHLAQETLGSASNLISKYRLKVIEESFMMILALPNKCDLACVIKQGNLTKMAECGY